MARGFIWTVTGTIFPAEIARWTAGSSKEQKIMRKTDPNAPAFARATDNPNLIGLTKREYFAARALQGMLAAGIEESLAMRRAVRVANEFVTELNKASETQVREPVKASAVKFEETSEVSDE